MSLPTTFESLIKEAESLELYRNLVAQLNKDLLLANLDLGFDEDILPTSLKLILQDEIYKLIQEKFIEYLNLLYIIDVSEKAIQAFLERGSLVWNVMV